MYINKSKIRKLVAEIFERRVVRLASIDSHPSTEGFNRGMDYGLGQAAEILWVVSTMKRFEIQEAAEDFFNATCPAKNGKCQPGCELCEVAAQEFAGTFKL